MYDDATNEQSGVKPSNSYNSYNYTNYNYSDDKTYNGDLSGKSVYGYGNENRAYGSYQYSNTGNAMNNGMQRPPRKKTGLKVVVSLVVVFAILSGVGIGGYLFHTFKHNVKVTTEKVEQTTAEASTEATQAVTQNDQNKVAATVSGEVKATVTDVTGVVQSVMPAMVIIHNNQKRSANIFGYVQTEEATASGSGIIVGQNDSELLIATNYHVVAEADSLEVIFSDGMADADGEQKSIKADIKGPDPEMDLAVIAVSLEDIPSETLANIKVATLGDSDALTLGEPAIAIGNALGYGQSVTTGVISAINRKVEIEEGVFQTFIQTDAAINPGNSGGALLNIQGEVIGINSNKIGGEAVEGMGYAIPISAAKPKIEELMNQETKKKVTNENRGYLGIKGVTVTSDVSQMYGLPLGVCIAEIVPGGGAEKAGIKKGDVIVKFDGSEIKSMDVLQSKLQYYAAGTSVNVTVMRPNGSEYEEVEVTVELAKDSGSSSESGESSSGAESESETSEDSQESSGG
ncbi:S1C family serine protease [Butyrivibrio sp. LB2008]|uniref:S1C family serine protease n=1 Tax=Butyrivibrio sp. LB2008 TaxID=1408305 RepID=UPI000688FF76|nr:trypsin-like peptidase domain-containing protein [Butyrivibrio sp. LB2008]